MTYSSWTTWESHLLRDQPLATQMEKLITDLISDGNLPVGTKMPSIRSLAKALNVNHRTVEKVYTSLYLKKILGSRGRSGTYVLGSEPGVTCSLSKVLAAPALFSFQSAESMVSNGAEEKFSCLTLGDAVPDPGILMDGKITSIYKEVLALHSIDKHRLQQQDTGLDEAILYLLKERGLEMRPDQFCHAPEETGITQFVLKSLLSPGDVAVLSSPTDLFYNNLILLSGAKVKYTGFDEGGMLPEMLEQFCRDEKIKVVVMRPNVDYPSGRMMPPERREELLGLSEKYEFVIIEVDDTPDLWFLERRAPLICESGSGRVIFISRVSTARPLLFERKIVVGPCGFIRNLKRMSCSFNPKRDFVTEKTIARLILEKGLASHLRRLMGIFGPRRQELKFLIDYYLGDRASHHMPAVGLTYWVHFYESQNWSRFSDVLTSAGIYQPEEQIRKNAIRSFRSLQIGFGRLETRDLENALKQITTVIR